MADMDKRLEISGGPYGWRKPMWLWRTWTIAADIGYWAAVLNTLRYWRRVTQRRLAALERKAKP